jgi:hypothetical protein|eukprot:7391567-Prymnesium_polylepis.3
MPFVLVGVGALVEKAQHRIALWPVVVPGDRAELDLVALEIALSCTLERVVRGVVVHPVIAFDGEGHREAAALGVLLAALRAQFVQLLWAAPCRVHPAVLRDEVAAVSIVGLEPLHVYPLVILEQVAVHRHVHAAGHLTVRMRGATQALGLGEGSAPGTGL